MDFMKTDKTNTTMTASALVTRSFEYSDAKNLDLNNSIHAYATREDVSKIYNTLVNDRTTVHCTTMFT